MNLHKSSNDPVHIVCNKFWHWKIYNHRMIFHYQKYPKIFCMCYFWYFVQRLSLSPLLNHTLSAIDKWKKSLSVYTLIIKNDPRWKLRNETSLKLWTTSHTDRAGKQRRKVSSKSHTNFVFSQQTEPVGMFHNYWSLFIICLADNKFHYHKLVRLFHDNKRNSFCQKEKKKSEWAI